MTTSTYEALASMQVISPWACLLIYAVVLVISIFILSNIDFGRVFKKEMQTPMMNIFLTVLLSLVITFCVGTFFIIISSLLFTIST